MVGLCWSMNRGRNLRRLMGHRFRWNQIERTIDVTFRWESYCWELVSSRRVQPALVVLLGPVLEQRVAHECPTCHPNFFRCPTVYNDPPVDERRIHRRRRSLTVHHVRPLDRNHGQQCNWHRRIFWTIEQIRNYPETFLWLIFPRVRSTRTNRMTNELISLHRDLHKTPTIISPPLTPYPLELHEKRFARFWNFEYFRVPIWR